MVLYHTKLGSMMLLPETQHIDVSAFFPTKFMRQPVPFPQFCLELAAQMLW